MSSNPAPFLNASSVAKRAFRACALVLLTAAALVAPALFVPLAAQDDVVVTPEPQQIPPPPADPDEKPARINLSVTVPRGDVNAAQAKQCEDEADAGKISGDIVVCRQRGESGENYFSGSASEARKRYANETAFKDDPGTPNVSGLPDNGGGISIGGVPPPALIIDVGALPGAPAGSDADRIARGLPPLGQDEDLSADEIRKRREDLGLPPPAFGNKKSD